ncbi:MAG: acyl carrier protein [Planctomycetia bacterium]|nr:acyl carrier protein [Planctomycetia bacterium]
MATKEEIFSAVQDVLVDSLAVDADEVTPDATLLDDLGAESIDLLEIVFSLEKKFEIKIDRSELIPEDIFTDAQYVVDGRLTPAGLSIIADRLPNANMEVLEQNPMVQNVAKVLTVQSVCDLVEKKLQ